jgi:hypothetical protein
VQRQDQCAIGSFDKKTTTHKENERARCESGTSQSSLAPLTRKQTDDVEFALTLYKSITSARRRGTGTSEAAAKNTET